MVEFSIWDKIKFCTDLAEMFDETVRGAGIQNKNPFRPKGLAFNPFDQIENTWPGIPGWYTQSNG
jgi:hypothetical protein